MINKLITLCTGVQSRKDSLVYYIRIRLFLKLVMDISVEKRQLIIKFAEDNKAIPALKVIMSNLSEREEMINFKTKA